MKPVIIAITGVDGTRVMAVTPRDAQAYQSDPTSLRPLAVLHVSRCGERKWEPSRDEIPATVVDAVLAYARRM